MAVGAWNLPPAMHRLSYLVGAIAVLSGTLTFVYGGHWPLVARIALAHTAIVAIIVAFTASTRHSARATRFFFGKDPITGRIPWWSLILLFPYHLVVRIVCHFYRTSSGENVFDEVGPKLYLGGWPLRPSLLPSPDCAVLDVTNELIRWVKVPAYKAVLVYESWAPEPEVMDEAVEWALAQQAAGRDVFVHCTHGHGRSAVTAAAILIAMGKAANPDEALAKTVKARPGVKPNYRQVAMLREWSSKRDARAHKS